MNGQYSAWRFVAAGSVLAGAIALAACGGSSSDSKGPAAELTPSAIKLEKIGTAAATDAGGNRFFDQGASEIPAFDPVSKRLFVVNAALKTVDVFNLADPANPIRIGQIDVSALGDSVNSVAVGNGIVALAIEAPVKQDAGKVAFYRASADFSPTASPVAAPLSVADVGALPDMLTFTPDGRTVLVANEGEPNSYNNAGSTSVDPEGSVSLVDISSIAAPVVRTVSFAAFNDQKEILRRQGIRIFGPNASVAQDLEPEYIAVAEDGKTAWVTLQENNAMAIIDVVAGTVKALVPLGYKDHFAAGSGLDARTRPAPGSVGIRSEPVFGMYQPDAIASYVINGETYLITANEGDVREYAGLNAAGNEAISVRDIPADKFSAGLKALCGGDCRADSSLGRLKVSAFMGNVDGIYDELFAFGARSFSIWTAAGDLVHDSGDEIEVRTAAAFPANFNASNTNNELDNRSDDKGPEPEGVTTGKIGSKTYAFIGLERVGGIMVYDVSVPTAPVFQDYLNPRDFTQATNTAAAGDLGPEGLVFISAARSPNGKPLLVVGNEISGTTAIYQVNITP